MMLTLLADHIWQSSLVLLAAAVLALFLRRARAQVRYWLWLAASLKFLVPFAVLVALGQQFAWSGGAADVTALVRPAAQAIVQPFSRSVVTWVAADAAPAAVAGGSNVLLRAFLVVWGVGVCAIGAAWLVRWRRVASLVRQGADATSGTELELLRALERRAGMPRAMPIVMSPTSMEPGVFGLFRPVLLWPVGISAQLNERQIEAILAHELAHVRRRDNLTAALHMVVQALFWFHPLVWWAGGRLVEERERACDEDVLRLGSDPEAYAAGILETCRFQIESPLTCVSGVTGADLMKRIEQIMENRVAGRLSARWQLLLAGVAVVAVAGPILVGTLTGKGELHLQAAPSARAASPVSAAPPHVVGPMLHQFSLLAWLNGVFSTAAPAAQAPASSPALEFEVAAVKENKSGNGFITFGIQPGGRFTAVNVTARELVRFAYGVQPFQIIEGPDWIDSAHFDVTAKAPDGVTVAPSPPGTQGPMQIMVRNLLADRFKLVVERPIREMPTYDLVLARADRKLGPKLAVSTTDCTAVQGRRGGGPPPGPPSAEEFSRALSAATTDRPPCSMMMGIGNLAADSVPIKQLAQILSNSVSRVVNDATGLEGNYSFTLEFTPDQLPAGRGAPPPGVQAPPPIDPNGPTIFTALEEQLGLKLQSKRGPVEALAIKSIELPRPD